jgi:cystathionine beta-lyase/cystathionine gamma-synthase
VKAGKTVMDAVKVCSFTTSLGEIDTLIIHPASTSHVSLTREEREAVGVSDGLMRLSVGIEAIDDLIDDLRQALDKI